MYTESRIRVSRTRQVGTAQNLRNESTGLKATEEGDPIQAIEASELSELSVFANVSSIFQGKGRKSIACLVGGVDCNLDGYSHRQMLPLKRI